MDQVCIRRLEVFAKHGVLPEENMLGQKFLISATMYCDTKKAGTSDKLADSVNYTKVSTLIKQVTEENTFHLLERLAEVLAEKILLSFPRVKRLDLEIEKPWAPVLLPLETVSVKISRGWNTAYLGIGSNLGDRENYLRQAINFLEKEGKIRVIKQSAFYETKPYGYTDQPDFLNGALEIQTLYDPEALLKKLSGIEERLGRERTVHWGPRTIDLDILLYNREMIFTDTLTIPHPEMTRREFVLAPLCEIAPYAWHPSRQKTAEQLFLEWKGKNGKKD